jgi:hypothetical protein
LPRNNAQMQGRKSDVGPVAEPLIDRDAVEHLLAVEHVQLRLAREDSATFCEYVLRNEETGQRISNSANHERWHTLLNEHPRVVIWAHPEAAKTQQMSVGRALWELGRNPNLRIACVSNTDGQARKICIEVAKYITSSEQLHQVFPHLKPGTGAPWTSHQIYVARDTIAKDPSYQTCGVHGNVLGSRIDLLFLDDILDFESTRSSMMCETTNRWFMSTLASRLTANSRVAALGMIWNGEDLMHTLAGNPSYVSIKSPVLDPAGNSTWPEQWPLERIEKKRIELGPLEFDRQMMLRMIAETEQRFKPEWIERCKERGEGKSLCYALVRVPEGYTTFTGVDLAVQDKTGSDETVFFTIAVHPDGTRELLDITAGKLHGPEIVDLIIDVQRRYQSVVVVENNAAQDFIIQFTRERVNIPIQPYTTNARAHHPEFGVESLGAEMASGKWIIPNNGGVVHPEVGRWINELIYYDPRYHTGDRLMASFFAREGSRMTAPKRKAQTFHLDLMSR